MPVYYDDNEAIFSFLDKIIDHNKIVIDYLAYSSYIYSEDTEADERLSNDDKKAYEYVISELKQKFPRLPEEECELILAEYIELEEEILLNTVKYQLSELLKNMEFSTN